MQATAQDLKAELEKSYKAFADALLAKDPIKFKSAMSASAYGNLKNRMSATGSKFPDAFFAAGPMMLKDLTKLKYHRALVNGVTANAIYSQKEEEETTLVILKFVKEATDWKFALFDMKGSDEINKAANAGDFSFLSGKEYQPSGIRPTIPAEIVAGEVQGILDVFCYEYKVSVTINGNEQSTTDNKSSSGWILGGLKKGKNKITITAKPVEGGKPATITIKIRIKDGDEENTVFSLEQNSPPVVMEKEFEVR